MKNANIGLLILSLFMFQLLESKQQNNNQKAKKVKTAKPAKSTAKRRVVVAAPVQDVVREEETHTVQETMRPLGSVNQI